MAINEQVQRTPTTPDVFGSGPDSNNNAQRQPDILDLPDPTSMLSHGNSIEYEANSQGMSSKSLGKTGGQGAVP